jgi:hypothetical protein
MNFGEMLASLFVVAIAIVGIAASFMLFGQPRSQLLARNVVLSVEAPLAAASLTAECRENCLPTANAVPPRSRPVIVR